MDRLEQTVPPTVYAFIVSCYLLRIKMYRVDRYSKEEISLESLSSLIFTCFCTTFVQATGRKDYTASKYTLFSLRILLVTDLARTSLLDESTVCPVQQSLEQKKVHMMATVTFGMRHRLASCTSI
jgi:hypothetical protein